MLQFEVSVLPYTGSDEWIEDTILAAHRCLQSESVPPPIAGGCDYCAYHLARLAAK